MANPYLPDIYAALPRVLALFDQSQITGTRGVGDRYGWAWKGSDFFNGTFQGAAHGISVLIAGNLLPDWLSKDSALSHIDAMINGTRRITRRDGSLDEIFPYEKSYCVTALVSFDLLNAIDLISGSISPDQRSRYLETVEPLIGFLTHNRESHGIISNHLAVAAAALARWRRETGVDVLAEFSRTVDLIFKHRSPEGWFLEYEGADPGYQTLMLDYLVDLHAVDPSLELAPAIRDAIQFIGYCAHPDGSFGGLYGSRNTRFLYPAGIEAAAGLHPEVAALARFTRKAHADRTVVGLAAMDDSNLVPMFNSFARASRSMATQVVSANDKLLPFEQDDDFRKSFPEAGFVVDKRDRTYSIVSWKKGGVVQSYSPLARVIDPGPLARDAAGHWYSTQILRAEVGAQWQDADSLIIEAPMARYHVRTPTPLDMIVLRVLSLTVMRIPALNVLVKRLLVKFLISRRLFSSSVNRRVVRFASDLSIEDDWVKNPSGLKRAKATGLFYAVHMASQGYWQRLDNA